MNYKQTRNLGLLALLLLAFLPLHAQKVKLKKDMVTVDGVEKYKYYRSKGKLTSPDQERVFTTLNNDTLIWVKAKELTAPKTPYENRSPSQSYWELSFAGSDSTMRYVGSVNFIYEDFVKTGLVKDDQLDLSVLPAYKLDNLRYLRPLTNMELGLANRQKLAELPGYPDYVKQLSKRDPTDILFVVRGTIYFQNTVGAPPDHIGTVEKKAVERGTEYRIYRKKDKVYVASIIHEPRTGMVFVKTWIDKASIDYTITVPFDEAMLKNAVQYLTEYGYL